MQEDTRVIDADMNVESFMDWWTTGVKAYIEMGDRDADKALCQFGQWLTDQRWSNGKTMFVLFALINMLYDEWLSTRKGEVSRN